jgi:hypothetical protein
MASDKGAIFSREHTSCDNGGMRSGRRCRQDVVEEDTEDKDVDAGGSEDTNVFVVTENLYENSEE